MSRTKKNADSEAIGEQEMDFLSGPLDKGALL